MQRVVINAFLATPTVLVFGAIVIWGSAITKRAGALHSLKISTSLTGRVVES
jgi:hypothetical protein